MPDAKPNIVVPQSVGQAGLWQSPYYDTMIDHDRDVGRLLDCLDEIGIAEDTIVIYCTDNGPQRNSWPDAGTTPFRGEKDTNREGVFGVPEMIRWPGSSRGTRRPASPSTTPCRSCTNSWPRTDARPVE
jgi:arylsulfatase A-like enzyme